VLPANPNDSLEHSAGKNSNDDAHEDAELDNEEKYEDILSHSNQSSDDEDEGAFE